ncbi:alanine--glyoxylate aminotransferase family protein [Halodesulfovibrio sp.]|jgi:aspartate aminotransferase-like enzyme|uniref:pyridoxal-phosphate-dependent aminotransferase family protein n=1 Tax=Halodesulfovibrio sp. TaxID=1912772 RepID=UPI0025DE3D63|nr:alanine--glyoxylate aminotransferase family protein [Halodesulfovibrio sp.]MCT4626583.1 alanine--glyoxylate aminotransferase family protein [Halodesulfovibrio sp.]
MRNKKRLLAPGPTPVPERVRLALAQDMIHHRKPEFKAIMAQVQQRLQKLFGTTQPVMPLACSGTGVMTAAVTNLFAAGEKVLVIEAGKFGERWGEICNASNVVVEKLVLDWGEAVTAEAVANMLDIHPDCKGVLVQLSETSTGVLHPVDEIAGVTKDRNVLLVVDGISAVSISPCSMDEWGIDCLLTGSQKGLMLPPGLGLIACSDKAWQKAESVTPSCFYFNLRAEKQKTLQNQTLFTTPVNLIVGLNESLAMFEETGFDAVFRKQWALTMMARTAIVEMGLELFAKDHFTWGLTSVLVPENVDASAVLEYAKEQFGVTLAGGQAHMKGRLVRIGHMGWVDWADLAAGLHAFAEGCKACGGSITSGYLEKGLHAYHSALNDSEIL